MKRRKLLSALILATTISSSPGLADSVPCQDKLALCKDVATACSAVVSKQHEQLLDFRRLVDIRTEEKSELQRALEEAKPAWYERPAVVIPMTVAVTLAVITALRSH